MRKTLVIGASEKPERYAFKAITSLVEHGHPVVALGGKSGEVAGVSFNAEKILFSDIDTITLYIGPPNQIPYYEYLEQLNPKRVIFNPGTENDELQERLKAKGIEVEVACTLVLLASNQYEL